MNIGLADYQEIVQRGVDAERARIRTAVEELLDYTPNAEQGDYLLVSKYLRSDLLAIIDGENPDPLVVVNQPSVGCPNCGVQIQAHYCMGPPAVDRYGEDTE